VHKLAIAVDKPPHAHANVMIGAAQRASAASGDQSVIASDSDAIQTKPPPQSRSLDRFALLAMTNN
jgi:hypothetical protein